uniref:Oxysterol-binding protein n=1 Tax=Salmo trutta TaxID=8032 RepID=A0A673WAM6_SALTR
MKEENLFHRRMSLSPNATSPSPPKIDHRSLTRNMSYGGESELFPLSPGKAGVFSLVTKLMQTHQNGEELPNLDCSSPTEKLARKESLKVQKKNYRQEKKRAAKELSSALKDPSVVITANWLKIRGSLKSWTKLWCALKPGVLLIYKTPKSDHWVGTLLLNACKLIERPSKKDGFCFKLYHPLDKSIWAVKGPKGENVGSITQPLPSNYLIFRAASESDGRCWMDALELALSCSSLYKLTAKAGRDGDLSTSSESSHILQLLQSTALTDESIRMNQNFNFPTLLLCVPFSQAGEASQVETVSEENKGLIWTLLKQLRPGMDLSKVVLPTFILEPRSFLDKLSDYYYHANLLSEAAREESPYGRIKQVVRWYLSGFYKKPKGLKKPYNPILGETFRCCWLHPQTDSCTFYIAEQISHHPPISAFYVCNKKDGFYISGSILAKSKFYGNSLSAILDGRARLMLLGRDEEYVITMPYAHCKGILYGTMTLELGGKITIECEKTKYVAELEFKLKPFLGGSSSVNVISGKIQQGDELLATVDGHWDGEVFLQEKKSGQQEHLWNPTPEVRSTRLKRQVVQLDQQGQFESERLWQHVTSAIVDRDQNQATQEKFVLEEAQRNQAKDRGDQPWRPRLFNLDSVTNEWTYIHIEYVHSTPPSGHTHTHTHTEYVHSTPPSGHTHTQSMYTAQVNGKHRKGSSQPSSCSQNTESSSTTPEPTHESSDNEGKTHTFTTSEPTHESSDNKSQKHSHLLTDMHIHRKTQPMMPIHLTLCYPQTIRKPNIRFSLPCHITRVPEPVCTVQQGSEGHRPHRGLHRIHTEDTARHPEVREHTHILNLKDHLADALIQRDLQEQLGKVPCSRAQRHTYRVFGKYSDPLTFDILLRYSLNLKWIK